MTPTKPIESRTLVVLRAAVDVTGKELAARLGIKPNTLYDYENGVSTPGRGLLEQAAAALGLPRQQVDRTLAYLRQTDASRQDAEAGPGEEAAREMAAIAHALGQEWEGLYLDLLRRGRIRALAFVKRQAAPLLWARLRTHPAEVRPAVVREKEEFRDWALAELVCHESIEAAADDADKAVALAELACRVAELVPETEPLRVRTQGYAAYHLGNALRVKGTLPTADAQFALAEPLWKAGAPGDPERLLNEARVLGMEASLRRGQRRLPEALDLLERALAADRGDLRVPLLINRAKILEEMGDYEEALATLRRALPQIDGEREPRLLWNVRFNFLVALCCLGRYDEAAEAQGEVRGLALRLGRRLILARMDWLQGWIEAGRGRHAEAELAFERARGEFLAQGIAFDAALVSLELAVLYLGQGRTAEVKALARELAPIFQEQRVTREAFATGVLFLEAVEQETISLEMARRFLADFRKQRTHQGDPAGGDPGRSRLRPGKGVRGGR